MISFRIPGTRNIAAALGVVALAACATPPPPPPPPPPPAPTPTPTPIPARPTPPNSAMLDMDLPLRNAYGQRMTVNTNLSTEETVWNLRSGLNVAALNCIDPQYEPILTAYTKFLGDFGKDLSRVNRTLDANFKERFGGTDYKRERDTYLTGVYNYFALPPATRYFCDAALEVANNYLTAPPTELEPFALQALPVLEGAFLRFFDEYEAYQLSLAEWNALYGPPPAPAPVFVESPVVQDGDTTSSSVPASTMGGTPTPAIDAPIVNTTPLPSGDPVVPPSSAVEEPVIVLEGTPPASEPTYDAPASPSGDPLPDAAPTDQPTVVSQPVIQQLPEDNEGE